MSEEKRLRDCTYATYQIILKNLNPNYWEQVYALMRMCVEIGKHIHIKEVEEFDNGD